ncbi:MAG: hypothetical protein GX483_09010 [Actinomycetaceae bacterium]|nr:hypothetical protein [Actinomycetaceae bacterium]
MLDIWDAIEADFQRDYGMDLSQVLDVISWRRFKVLMDNLSPFGAVATSIQAIKDTQPVSEDEKVQAESFFSSIASISR